MFNTVLWLVVAAFPTSEIVLALFKRSDSRSAQPEDRGSMRLLWLAITLGVAAAIAVAPMRAFRLPFPGDIVRALGVAVLAGGLVLRWVSIVTLGRLFTVDVAIQQNHSLVERGPYRFVRHPSYSGLLVAFLGLGLFYVNWLSLLVLMVPVTLAVINRIAREEQALVAALGPAYSAYCSRTKRLFPSLF
ncbi:MAG TPA: isoprenylcysteine carboxylmethyltransferase family protein [Vicinamibacterales bacterium]|jgi:protein-S-isoprenylcysteine O-methyltransferase